MDGALSRPRSASIIKTSDVEDITAIAIMGVTGSGKSNFIKLATNSDRVKVGHNLQSCTQSVSQYEMLLEGRQVILFDTPGFDDTYRLDADILAELAETLSALYKHNLKLAGIIYVHRITDNRMTNTLLRNLSVIRNLCGVDPLKNVTLVTTHWDIEVLSIAEKREREMIETEDWWGYMISKGSKFRRFVNTPASAHSILTEYLSSTKRVLQIQSEIVDHGLDINQTAAGTALNHEIAALAEKHNAEILALEHKMNKAMSDHDEEMQDLLSRERKEKEKELRRMQREQLALERDRSEDMRRMEQTFQDQLLRLVEDKREREAELRRMQDDLSLERAESQRRVEQALATSEANVLLVTQQFESLRAEDREKYAHTLERYQSERDQGVAQYKREMELANAALLRKFEEKQNSSDAERERLEREIMELQEKKRKSKAGMWAKIGGVAACAILAPLTGGLSTLFLPAFGGGGAP